MCLDGYFKYCVQEYDQVIMVDNASSDNTSVIVQNKYPEVQVVRSEYNTGYSGGNNIGIMHALKYNPKYVMFLNNDTVVNHNFIDDLVKCFEESKGYGALSPFIYVHNLLGQLWYSGVKWDKRKAKFVSIKINIQSDIVYESDHASGCAMMLTKDALLAAGQFDERFFLTWEESDLCYRLRYMGYNSGVVPSKGLEHKVSRSFDGLFNGKVYNYYYSRNRLLFLRKHWKTVANLSTFKEVSVNVLRDVRCRYKNSEESEGANARLRGFIDGLFNRYGRYNT